MFKVILGSFSALVSKWPVSLKGLAIEEMDWNLGGMVSYIYGVPVTFLVLKAILGSFSTVLSKWRVSCCWAKTSEIGGLGQGGGVGVGLIGSTWGTLDLSLRSSQLGIIYCICPVTRKRLSVRWNWLKLEGGGVTSEHIWANHQKSSIKP